MGSFIDIVVLLFASVVIVGLFRRMNLPPILAYLYVGLLIGPYGLGLVDDDKSVHILAEFGVVFLLFTIGLEFSLPQIISMKWIVFGLGGAQVMIATGLTMVIGYFIGLDPVSSFIVGGAVAMSSTALVVKQLDEQGEQVENHGKTSIGVLIFQDMAVVPFLILIPIFASGAEGSMAVPLITALLKGAFVFVLMLLAGRLIIRPLFHEIALARSTELFTLTVLLVIIVAAWATHFADLSLTMGAFLAGMVLGETEYKHQIESDIRPFRDVLLGLFFITIGMLLDVEMVKRYWFYVLPAFVAILVVKTMLVFAIMNIMGDDKRNGLRSGLILSQGGEFGFALISIALASNLISEIASQVVLAAVFLSMVVAPFLIRFNGKIATWIINVFSFSGNKLDEVSEVDMIEAVSRTLNDHIIIVGYGRHGQNVSRFYDVEGVKYLALDLDPERIKHARSAGEYVTFGDATRDEILKAAGLEKAKLVMITIENPSYTTKVIRNVRKHRIDIPICALAYDDTYMDKFRREGATDVVPQIFESSLMLAAHSLPRMGVPMSQVLRHIREFRKDGYSKLRGFFHGQRTHSIEGSARSREQLRTISLGMTAHAVGKELGDLALDDVGVTITSIRRRNIRVPDPTSDVKLLGGDILVAYGAPEELEKAEALILSGSI